MEGTKQAQTTRSRTIVDGFLRRRNLLISRAFAGVANAARKQDGLGPGRGGGGLAALRDPADGCWSGLFGRTLTFPR